MKQKQKAFFKLLSIAYCQVFILTDDIAFIKDYLGRIFILDPTLIKALELNKLEHKKIYRIGVK